MYDKTKGIENPLIALEAKRRSIEALVSGIQIYEERQQNGQWIKSVKFKLPVIEEDTDIHLGSDGHAECICLMKKEQNTFK
ncbi:MAG: hypothetical protein MSJ26_03955 [Oscillospiraceae bacterium]|nr:hypothetical protein [Oscillospiraceae bacterium]